MPRAGQTLIDIEAHRAANAARYYGDMHPRWGRQPMGSKVYAYRGGLKVTVGTPRKPWCETEGKRGRYAHRPRVLFIVWRRGEVVLVDTRYFCGGNSTNAVQVDFPAKPRCPKCLLQEIGPAEAVRRLTADAPSRV